MGLKTIGYWNGQVILDLDLYLGREESKEVKRRDASIICLDEYNMYRAIT
jgi:hypothetical protein